MATKAIFRLVSHIQFLANEHGAYIPVQKVADTLGQASKHLFNALLFPKQTVKNGRTFGAGFNKAVDTRLLAFLAEEQYAADANEVAQGGVKALLSGVFQLPDDFAQAHTYTIPGAKNVEEVAGHALNQKLSCEITGPTTAYPLIADYLRGSKKVYPENTPRLTLHYYAQPPAPVYALSDPEDDTSYDDANSVDTGWREDSEPELIARSLTLLGIPLRDPALQQAGIAHTQQDL